jgi:LmbE family N-acetylglucosaminyl deacetylase
MSWWPFCGAFWHQTYCAFATWEHDGHPDHDAAGDAVARACATTGAPFLHSLVWTWH